MKDNTIKVFVGSTINWVTLSEEAINQGKKIPVVEGKYPITSSPQIGEVVAIEEVVTDDPEVKKLVKEKTVRHVTVTLNDGVTLDSRRGTCALTLNEHNEPVLVYFGCNQAIYSAKHMEVVVGQLGTPNASGITYDPKALEEALCEQVRKGDYSRQVPTSLEGTSLLGPLSRNPDGSVSDIGRGLTEEARMKLFQEQNPHLKEEQTLEEIIVKIFEGRLRGQIISKEEAEGRRRNHPSGSVISHTFWIGDEKKWYFFSDDHCFGLDMLEGVVPCSSYLPCKIVAREGFEDGLIKTVDEMIRLHHPNDIYISSIEELVAVLVKYPEFIHKKLMARATELM